MSIKLKNIFKKFKTNYLLKMLRESRRKKNAGKATLKYRDEDQDLIVIEVTTDDLKEELDTRENVLNKIERRKARQKKAKDKKSFSNKLKRR